MKRDKPIKDPVLQFKCFPKFPTESEWGEPYLMERDTEEIIELDPVKAQEIYNEWYRENPCIKTL